MSRYSVFFAISSIVTHANALISPAARSRVLARRQLSLSSTVTTLAHEHKTHLETVAKTKAPKKLPILLELLESRGYTLVGPKENKDLNPFLVPLAKRKDNSMLCYIRWPTQKDDMDLQLVETTDVGVKLVSVGTDQLVHRIAVEADFYSKPNAPKAIELLNKDGPKYQSGDFLPLLRSGKFPSLTENDLRLILDRFILTKVGAFPDCYERLANYNLEAGQDVNALVTCERAVSVFYGWGHPTAFHAKMLAKIDGRDKEARDAARAALNMPKWTVANTKEDLETVSKLAGFTGAKILGEMHAFRSTDPRTDEIGEGLSPAQVTLDQAAHLMDAVTLGAVPGGWSAPVKQDLASKYREGGYPDIASWISE